MDLTYNKLYFADTGNRRIRSVDLSTGIISTIAGGGSVEVGDGLDAKSARLSSHPMRVSLSRTGDLLVADAHHNRIRQINSVTGIITTVSGSGNPGFTGDGIPAHEANLRGPHAVRCDKYGNIYIADTSNHRVRKVMATTGIITTIAGNGEKGYTGDNIPAIKAQLNTPISVDVDNYGNAYIAECLGYRIRRIDAETNIITTIAGNGELFKDNVLATQIKLSKLRDVVVEESDVFIVEGEHSRIRKIDTLTGLISTVAGTGEDGWSGDGGKATKAKLNGPYSIAIDKSHIYILDGENRRIRRIHRSTGIIYPFAGNGIKGFSGDSKNALNASISTGK